MRGKSSLKQRLILAVGYQVIRFQGQFVGAEIGVFYIMMKGPRKEIERDRIQACLRVQASFLEPRLKGGEVDILARRFVDMSSANFIPNSEWTRYREPCRFFCQTFNLSSRGWLELVGVQRFPSINKLHVTFDCINTTLRCSVSPTTCFDLPQPTKWKIGCSTKYPGEYSEKSLLSSAALRFAFASSAPS